LASSAAIAASKPGPRSGATDDGAGAAVCTWCIIVSSGDSDGNGTSPVKSSKATTPNE
jgi:hypothetical protein